MQNKLAVAILLSGLVCLPTFVSAETASEAVELFYTAATTDGMCDKAMQIREDYTQEQCKSLKKVKIRKLKLLKETEDEAIFYLNMKYTSNKPQRFSGYIHLYKKDGQWMIIGSDYKSSKAMSRSQYIRTYMGTGEEKLKPKEKVVVEPDTLAGNHREVLDQLSKRYPNRTKENPVVLIDVSEQELYLYVKKQLKRIYPVSTARNGVEANEEKDWTPLGAHIVKQKIGENAVIGSIFLGRQDTGRIAKLIKQAKDTTDDYPTSRIFWLSGLEEGKNRGGDIDSYNRFIYIQGTAEEGLIGRKVSKGSIRMYNKDVIELFNKLPINSIVYIGR